MVDGLCERVVTSDGRKVNEATGSQIIKKNISFASVILSVYFSLEELE